MQHHKWFDPGAVLAACTDKMAVSHSNQDGFENVLQVAFLDLSTDAAPGLHYIDIAFGFYPSGLSLSPSGEFQVVKMW